MRCLKNGLGRRSSPDLQFEHGYARRGTQDTAASSLVRRLAVALTPNLPRIIYVATVFGSCSS